MAKPKVNEELCIGCQACQETCPEVFVMDETTGKSKVIAQECTDCCEAAANGCPTSAITIE